MLRYMHIAYPVMFIRNVSTLCRSTQKKHNGVFIIQKSRMLCLQIWVHASF